MTYPEGRPRDWVVTDTAGSLLAWLEYPGRRLDRTELVVDDSDSRAVLDRTPIAVPDGGSATILAVADRGVFMAEDPAVPVPGSLRRYDGDAGVLEPTKPVGLALTRCLDRLAYRLAAQHPPRTESLGCTHEDFQRPYSQRMSWFGALETSQWSIF